MCKNYATKICSNCRVSQKHWIGLKPWCNWIASCDGEVTIQTCGGTAVDTKLAVYDGAGCPATPPLACNDDTCGLQSLVTFTATAGAVYRIRIGTFPGAAGGTGAFSITCPPQELPCDLVDCQDFVTDNASQSNTTAFCSADRFAATRTA